MKNLIFLIIFCFSTNIYAQSEIDSQDTISSAKNIDNLKKEIYKFTKEESFIKSKSMGELMEHSLDYLKTNYQNVSLIDLI